MRPKTCTVAAPSRTCRSLCGALASQSGRGGSVPEAAEWCGDDRQANVPERPEPVPERLAIWRCLRSPKNGRRSGRNSENTGVAGEGFFLDIILGVIGAIVGGWLFAFFGKAEVTGFNLYSMFVAIVGAIVVLVVYHAIRRTVWGKPRCHGEPVAEEVTFVAGATDLSNFPYRCPAHWPPCQRTLRRCERPPDASLPVCSARFGARHARSAVRRPVSIAGSRLAALTTLTCPAFEPDTRRSEVD